MPSAPRPASAAHASPPSSQLKTMEGVLEDLPPYVEKIRAWSIKQRSMAKRKLVKASQPLVYVPPPPQAPFA